VHRKSPLSTDLCQPLSTFSGLYDYAAFIPGARSRSLTACSRDVEIPLATPLAAYLRVPLAWYHSATHPFFPDESHASIHRVYTHPTQQHSKRHFCGFCGTPLSYWSEEPQSEAAYIHLTLGSLLSQDLRDLEELGLIPDAEASEPEPEQEDPAPPYTATAEVRAPQAVPASWFDTLVEGTRLVTMRRSHVVRQSKDGHVKVEWEIMEWTDGDGSQDADESELRSSPAKRKLQDMDVDVDDGAEL